MGISPNSLTALISQEAATANGHCSIYPCRMIQLSSETLEPNVTLSANLPSLRFHVDEQKVSS